MKARFSLSALLLLCLPMISYGQAIQSRSCSASPCALSCVVPGDLLVTVGRDQNPPVSQPGEYWMELYSRNWNGDRASLWFTAAVGGNESVSFQGTHGLVVSEYPPASFDGQSAVTSSCCGSNLIAAGPVSTTALRNGTELLLMWTGYTYGDQPPVPLTAGSGFTLDGQIPGDIAIESREVAADLGGSYSGTFGGPDWPNGATIASFRLKRYSSLQPIQTKSCLQLACSFDNPLVPGNLIIAMSELGNNPVSDAQRDNFQLALPGWFYLGPMSYALNAIGGATTITFPSGTLQAFIAEYPPSLGLDDANPGSYATNNPHGDVNGQSSDWGVTWPLLTSQPGDLIVAWEGNGSSANNLYTPTAGPNATVRGVLSGMFMFEDMVTGVPNLYIISLQWNTYGHWVMGAAAFKM